MPRTTRNKIAFKKVSDRANDKSMIMVSLKDEQRRKEQQKLYSPVKQMNLSTYLWTVALEQAVPSNQSISL